jgi:hypothetical protein
MSEADRRFGRRTGRDAEARTEPVFSFGPKRPAREDIGPPRPAARRPIAKPQGQPPIDRDNAEELGAAPGRQQQTGPRAERDRDRPRATPRARRGEDDEGQVEPALHRTEKAMEPRIPDPERPLYHHLFDDLDRRHRGIGWATALASVAVVAIGAVYAWQSFMSRPVPPNLFEPRGLPSTASLTNDTKQLLTTPPFVSPNPASQNPLSQNPAPPAGTPDSQGRAPQAIEQATQDVSSRPEPKSIPSEPPPPPRKTISEAAGDPSGMTPAKNDGAASAPPAAPAPAAPAKTASNPPPAVTTDATPVAPPPPAAKTPAADVATAVPPPPKHESAKREEQRKEAAIDVPKPREPAPAPAQAAPAVNQRAAAPAVAPPARYAGAPANARPQSLNRSAPAAQPRAPQTPPPQEPPSYATRQPPPSPDAGPPPNASDTVTIDGLTYVSGQEPHALGTLGGPPQAAAEPAMPPATPPARPVYARPYTPVDREGGAPLPNDVIMLPNGQLAVPNGAQ